MKQKWLITLFFTMTCLFSIPPEIIPLHETNHYHLYLWGVYNQFERKEPIVRDCFNILTNSDCSWYAYAGYIQHLLSTKQYKKIIDLMPKLEEPLGNDLETQLTFVKVLEIVGRNEDAEKKIISLYDTHKTNPEVTYGCALAFIRTKQLTRANSALDQFLESTTEKPMHFIFYYLKAQIAAQESKKDVALKYISKCLALNPSFDQGWLFSGLLHELQGNLDDAISGYKNFLQLVGRDSAVEQQIMMLLMKQKQLGVYKNEIRSIFEEALMLFHQHQCSQALKRIDHCLQIDPGYRPARLLKIELLCSLQQTEQAVNLLKTWINKEPKEDIWYRAAHLLFQAGKAKDEIITMLESVEKKYNHSLLPQLYLADIYLKNANLIAAKKYLKKSLSLSTNKLLKTKISYQLSIMYYDEKDYDALAQTLEYGLSLQQEFLPLSNLAAYYYATKGNNIIKAQALLDPVLKIDPKNPHYLDTQALIWYKQVDYQKAEQLLFKLTQQLPQDFYIQNHLGKTLFKQGNTSLALDVIKKALHTQCSEHQKNKCLQRIQAWNKLAKNE